MSGHDLSAVVGARAGAETGKIDLNFAPSGPPPRRYYEHERPESDLDGLKAAVDLAELVEREAGVRLHRSGANRAGPCPLCQQKPHKRSFTVYPAGRGWHCHACGEGGDVLAFLQALHGWGFGQALAHVRDLAGGADHLPARRLPTKAELDAEAARERAAKVRAARRLWGEASPELPAETSAYWREARGLPDVPAGMRWHPSCPYQDGEGEPARVGAILAPITDAAGAVVAVHRIPPVPPAGAPKRLTLGAKKGGAVRLGAGPVLILAEGVETAAAAAALLGLPAWACVDAGNLAEQTLPPETVELVICADHDTPSRQFPSKGGAGWAEARRAAAVYAAAGRRVRILTTPEPKSDANDALRGLCGALCELAEAEPAAEASPAVAVPEPAREAPEKPTPFALPAFPRPTLDNAEALAAAEAELAAVMEEAVAYAAGELGEDAEPPRWLANVTVGTGKSEAYVRALAEAAAGGRLAGGVLVAVPSLALADELKARLEKSIQECDERRHGGGIMLLSSVNVRVWRGRTKERAGEPDGGERMCRRPKALVERVQRTGARVDKALCALCPLRDGCRYLMQAAEVRREGGRTILLTSHEHLFLPLPEGFSPRLVVVDEGLGGRMTRQRLVEPETVAEPRLWAGDGEGAAVAAAVGTALRDTNRELAALREAGVTGAGLERAAKGLRARYDALVAAVEDGGFSTPLDQALAAAEGADHRAVAFLMEGLAAELATGREGTNGTRMEARSFEVTADDGSKSREEREVFVARGLRPWRVKASAAVVILDATADRGLVETWLGAPVRYVEHAIPLLGAVIQVRDTTYSKAGLLFRAEAENGRARLVAMIRDAYRLAGGSLFVCATAEVERALRAELADLAGVVWMHYGAERGSDAAKACRVGIVVGRERPDVRAIEDTARAFAAGRVEPFAAAGTGRFGSPDLAPATRPRLMRDGSAVAGAADAHPDPLGRAVLAQVMEASVVQAAGRLRMAREGGKLLILAGRLPVPIEVDRLFRRGELESALALAGEARDGMRASGVYLLDPRAAKGRADRTAPSVGLAAWLLGRAGNRANSLIGSNKGFGTVSAFPALYRGGARGPRREAWLFSALPPAEAFAAAREAGRDVLPVEPIRAPEKVEPGIVRRSGDGGVIRLNPEMRGGGRKLYEVTRHDGRGNLIPSPVLPALPKGPAPGTPAYRWAMPALVARHERRLAAWMADTAVDRLVAARLAAGECPF